MMTPVALTTRRRVGLVVTTISFRTAAAASCSTHVAREARSAARWRPTESFTRSRPNSDAKVTKVAVERIRSTDGMDRRTSDAESADDAVALRMTPHNVL